MGKVASRLNRLSPVNCVGTIGFENEVSLSGKIIMVFIAIDHETSEDGGCFKGRMVKTKGLAFYRHEISSGRDELQVSPSFRCGRTRIADEPEHGLDRSKALLINHDLKHS